MKREVVLRHSSPAGDAHHARTHRVSHARTRRDRLPAISRFVREHLLLLPLGAAVALVWANTLPESYFRFSFDAQFWVNDLAMAVFFALMMKEVVEAGAEGGALHTWRRLLLPLVVALGGVVVPAVLYVQVARWLGEPMLIGTWLVTGCVDLALVYAVARLVFSPRHPAIPFALLLGIAANALTLLVLAVLHPVRSPHLVEAALLMITALIAAAAMRRARVRSFWPYLALAGTLSWFAFYVAGTHTALALVPIVALMPHARRDPGFFVDASGRPHDPLTAFERAWSGPAQGILFVFGLVNGGLLLTALEHGVLTLPLATLAGRPVGVLAGAAVALAIGLRLPRGLGLRELGVLAIASAAGFTFALFVASAMLGPGQMLAEIRMGALLALAAVPLTVAAARVLGVGRYATLDDGGATRST